jgi:hypothetical protein
LRKTEVVDAAVERDTASSPLRSGKNDALEDVSQGALGRHRRGVIPLPSRDCASRVGRVGRRERLGGVLSFYAGYAA